MASYSFSVDPDLERTVAQIRNAITITHTWNRDHPDAEWVVLVRREIEEMFHQARRHWLTIYSWFDGWCDG